MIDGELVLGYIAGPLRDPEAPNNSTARRELNIRRAELRAIQVAGFGRVPVCPHLLTGRMVGALSEEEAMAGARELLRACHELWLVEGWERSDGTWQEIGLAAELGIPIFLPDNSPLRAVVFRGEVRMLHTENGLLFAETSAAS